MQELNAFASQRLDFELDDEAKPAFGSAFVTRQPSDAGSRLQPQAQPQLGAPRSPSAVSDTPILSQASSRLPEAASEVVSEQPSGNFPTVPMAQQAALQVALPQQPQTVRQPNIPAHKSDTPTRSRFAEEQPPALSGESQLLPQTGLVKGLSDTPWLSREPDTTPTVVSERSNSRQESFGASSFADTDFRQPGPVEQPGRPTEQPPVAAPAIVDFAPANANGGVPPATSATVPTTAYQVQTHRLTAGLSGSLGCRLCKPTCILAQCRGIKDDAQLRKIRCRSRS